MYEMSPLQELVVSLLTTRKPGTPRSFRAEVAAVIRDLNTGKIKRSSVEYLSRKGTTYQKKLYKEVLSKL